MKHSKEAKEIYIDIGFPRCASTFRQKRIYPYLEDVHYIHQPFSKNLFHGNKKMVFSNGKNLISDETLTGVSVVPSRGTYRKDTLENIKIMFPDAKIIISVREKEPWIMSAYKDYVVVKGGTLCFENWHKRVDIDSFNVGGFIDFLKHTFNDVLVLDFEDLKYDKDKYLSDICKFLDTDVIKEIDFSKVNKSFKDHKVRTIRWLNKLFWSDEKKGIPLQRFLRFFLKEIS